MNAAAAAAHTSVCRRRVCGRGSVVLSRESLEFRDNLAHRLRAVRGVLLQRARNQFAQRQRN